MNITLDTYIISDTHFGHKNIIKYCDRPMNHNELMLHNWASTVGYEDKILHLGDVMFNDTWLEFVEDMPGEKYLIPGNHDHTKTVKKMKKVFQVIEPFTSEIEGYGKIKFSHYPVPYHWARKWDINIHGHIHNNGYETKVDRLSGFKWINVSVEVMDYTPVTLREILEATTK